MSGVLKRKYDELEDDQCYLSSSPSSSTSSSTASSGWDSEEESSGAETMETRPSAAFTLTDFASPSIMKKIKRLKKNNVQFDRVTVFYFPRCQGFTSVPSRGGCTLGMVWRHSSCRQYTLAEFAKEQVHLRREKLKERLKEEKLEALKLKVSK
uniref:Cysteine/serine-rich nuclear protein N-terminal domain-containing protein n=1 Tax=Latimeria chalumnae TaxID=7897 RepID=H2ZRJ3_LATCH